MALGLRSAPPRSVSALRLLFAVSACQAARLEITGDDANTPSVVFQGVANEEFAVIAGSSGAVNVSSRAYAPDFITSSGTSLDEVGRRLGTIEQDASCSSLLAAQATEIAALRADMATLIAHFKYFPPSLPPPPMPPLAPTQYTGCQTVVTSKYLNPGDDLPSVAAFTPAFSSEALEACWEHIVADRQAGGPCAVRTDSWFSLSDQGHCRCYTGTIDPSTVSTSSNSGAPYSTHSWFRVFNNCQVVPGTG